MKIEEQGGGFIITDETFGDRIVLNAEQALSVLEFLYQRKGELTRQVNGLEISPPAFTQQTKPDASTRFRASWIDDLEI